MIDHCYAERDKELRREALEYYITDTLQLIGKNIASLTQGKYLATSWRNLCEHATEKYEQKTGDEIAEDVISRAGLMLGGD